MLLALVVAILTCMTVVNATQTITTPNAAFIAYSLAGGKSSAPITPAASRSVLVMGCCTTTGGVGQVSLSNAPLVTPEWVGLESPSSSASTITSGVSATLGTHIVFIDVFHQVDIQVASATTILIHNGSTGTRTGNVTLIW
jgi:hypothetical protein